MGATRKSGQPRKRGRSSSYSEQIGLAICARLAEGESLRTICGGDGMPDKSTVLRWLISHEDFRRQYIHARELGADTIAETALADAIAPMRNEDVQRARLAFDARRWFVGKLAPKKYGDRVHQEVSGPGGGPVETREAPPAMVPAEVRVAVRKLISGAELAVGLPPGSGSDAERLRAVLATGQPLDPDTYEALFSGGGM
jgi:hypothetical protein